VKKVVCDGNGDGEQKEERKRRIQERRRGGVYRLTVTAVKGIEAT
jgi:hypothetical protein